MAGKAAQKMSGPISLVSAVGRQPTDLRHVPSWVGSLRRSTTSLKLPWLPFSVIEHLDRRLSKDAKVLEYGGGGSTLWFAERVGEVHTIEHHAEWAAELRRLTRDHPNVTIHEVPADSDFDRYVGAADQFDDDFFDLVAVDGRERVRCFERSLRIVKPGGLLLLDDINRSRYDIATEIADGWRRSEFRGLTPTKKVAGHTAVWERPST